MPVFTKPRFDYDYDLDTEIAYCDEFFDHTIPEKLSSELDLATWNIANLGVQKRRSKDLLLIAHILSKFDIIAVQEIHAQLAHFDIIMNELAELGFDSVFTDVAGNSERLGIIYHTDVLRPGRLMGELDYNPDGVVQDGEYVIKPKKQSFRLNGQTIDTFFDNFNRNPFLTTWEVIDSDVSFMLANVHIYWGKKKTEDLAKFNNRIAEVYFLAEWAKERQRASNSDKVYEPNVILIGDMNVPTIASDDPVYRALKRRGFMRTEYSSEAGTTIQEFTTYDQVVFANDNIAVTEINGHSAVVFDYDNFVFRDLWDQVEANVRTLAQFKAWTKFAISDHRPVFVRLQV